MAEITYFLLLLMALRSHNTCNQGNKCMEIYGTILCINMQLIPWRSKRVGSYIYLNLKFHDYSNFFMAFDIASDRFFKFYMKIMEFFQDEKKRRKKKSSRNKKFNGHTNHAAGGERV